MYLRVCECVCESIHPRMALQPLCALAYLLCVLLVSFILVFLAPVMHISGRRTSILFLVFPLSTFV